MGWEPWWLTLTVGLYLIDCVLKRLVAETMLWLGSCDLISSVGIFYYMVIGVNRGLCSDINNGFIKRIYSCSNHYLKGI